MNERNFTIETLVKVYRGGYASELLLSIPRGLNGQLIRQLTMGVIENDLYLEVAIKHKLDRPMDKMSLEAITILKLGLYQKFFMDNIPEYALVSESLKSCEYFKLPQIKGLVNYVLRNSSKDEVEEIISKMPAVNDRLKTKYSVGDDFYDLLLRNYKIKTIRKILSSYLEESEFIIRVNYLKTDMESLKKDFDNNQVEYIDHDFLENSLIIKNPKGIFELDSFKEGKFTIQGGGSILTSMVLNPKVNSNVLDICAAPGGKTCHLSEIMKNTGTVVANDLYESRIKRIKENSQRLGCENISYVNFDATDFKKDFVEKFDFILLDAPCSGSGIVSKNPEIKIRRTRSEVQELLKTQRQIMDNCLKYLKPGGQIVYSTCSIFSEENELQREYFLDRYKNIRSMDFTYRENEVPYLRLMPYERGTDGFFICKFEKISN